RRGARACARRGDAGEGPTRRATGLRGLQLRVGWPRPGDDRPARRLLERQDPARARPSRGPLATYEQVSWSLRAELRQGVFGQRWREGLLTVLLGAVAVTLSLAYDALNHG